MTQNDEHSFFQSILNFLKGFGIRILVHCSAFIAALQVSGLAVEYDSISGIFAAYMAFICLLARATSLHFTWLMPAILGLVQVLFCSLLGLFLVPSLFLGGLQAYIQRIFIKKFNMGSEWIAVPFLLLALFGILPLSNLALTLASFAFLFFIGILTQRFYALYVKKQEEEKRLQAERKIQIEQKKNRDPFEEYRQSVKNLYQKQSWLPQNSQKTLLSLALSADAIISCMKEDNRDIKSGEKFLARYLPATHSVLDSYKRHQTSPKNETITNALLHSEEVLARLAEAFAKEHEYLLRNDADDFSANLRVLDTLLKMERQ